MAFNGGYPATYQQMYYPQQYQTQQNSGMIWVSGEAGAKAYLVAPNTTVQLWDSEAQVVYLKSADASGMPSMKVLDYTIRQTPSNGHVASPAAGAANTADYATHAEIDALAARIDALKQQMDGMAAKGAALNE